MRQCESDGMEMELDLVVFLNELRVHRRYLGVMVMVIMVMIIG